MRPKLLHEIIADIISAMIFRVSFKSVTDNGDGTFTLNDVCDFHHCQPGFPIKINGNDYEIVDYDYSTKILIVKGANSIGVNSFILDKPFFFHGTPVQQEAELTKIQLDDKVPMVYFMEPYETETDYSPQSSIDRRTEITLCFLTSVNIPKLVTDDLYHNGINPMKNLMEDVIQALIDSNLFYVRKQKDNPKFYTKFGINIANYGTKKLYFSENLSGVGDKIKLEIYHTTECECSDEGAFSSGFSNGFNN